VRRLHLAPLAVRGGHLDQGTNCTPVGAEDRIAAPQLLDVLLDPSSTVTRSNPSDYERIADTDRGVALHIDSRPEELSSGS
jgi:hypothetical protein